MTICSETGELERRTAGREVRDLPAMA